MKYKVILDESGWAFLQNSEYNELDIYNPRKDYSTDESYYINHWLEPKNLVLSIARPKWFAEMVEDYVENKEEYQVEVKKLLVKRML